MKPMLAATVEDVADLQYPLLASPKLDGIRAFVEHGCLLSRNRKPIPNRHVQDMFNHLEHHDGELIVGPPNAPDVYRTTMSAVMSYEGQPTDVNFYVFDHVANPTLPYPMRANHITEKYKLQHHVVYGENDLLELETKFLAEGYEGIMLRSPGGEYKYGRSTMNQGYLMKLKRFSDSEASVVGFEELMHNANEAKINELGYQARSSHQANLVPTGRLGALMVVWNGKFFNIGTGFTDAERIEIWENRKKYELKVAKFKYLAVGMKDLPRHPVFLGWRSKFDF
jgi:DNA ligase-1